MFRLTPEWRDLLPVGVGDVDRAPQPVLVTLLLRVEANCADEDTL